jgi:hypothetical protein
MKGYHPGVAESYLGPVDVQRLIAEETFAIFDAYRISDYEKNNQQQTTGPLLIDSVNGKFMYLRIRQLNQISMPLDKAILNKDETINLESAESASCILLVTEFGSSPSAYQETIWEKYFGCFVSWPNNDNLPSYDILNMNNGSEPPFEDMINIYDVMRKSRSQLNSKMLVGYASILFDDLPTSQ